MSRCARPVEREGEAEGAVGVEAVAQRIPLAREIVEVAIGDDARQGRERKLPARGGIVAGATEFEIQREKPRPAVRALEGARLRTREVVALGRDVRGREVEVEHGVDRGADRQRRKQPAHAREQPVHVHARMPVEAAVERGVQVARPAHVGGVGQDVILLGGILAHDVGERHAREGLGLVDGQEVGGEMRVRTGRRAHRATLRAGVPWNVLAPATALPLTDAPYARLSSA